MSQLSWLGSLYRIVLRSNRALAPELRTLGDSYASSEFKQMRNFEKSGKGTAATRKNFVAQWSEYCEAVAQKVQAEPTDDLKYIGEELDVRVEQQLSPEQKQQLLRLKREAEAVFRQQ